VCWTVPEEKETAVYSHFTFGGNRVTAAKAFSSITYFFIPGSFNIDVTLYET